MSTIRRFLDSQSRAVVAAGAIMVAAAALWITSDYRDWIAFGGRMLNTPWNTLLNEIPRHWRYPLKPNGLPQDEKILAQETFHQR